MKHDRTNRTDGDRAVLRFSNLTRRALCLKEACNPEMEAFLRDPDPFLEDPPEGFLKKGSTSTVARIMIAGRPLVVKRYNIKGFFHGLRRAFMKSRADRSWRNAKALSEAGIATPSPVAMIEKRIGPFRGTAYFITEFVEGPRAKDFFKDNGPDRTKGAADRTVHLFETFKRNAIGHGDMKSTNIIIRDGEPVILDLDAMRIHRSRSRFARAHRKDLERFLRNWEDLPEVRTLFRRLLMRSPLKDPGKPSNNQL